MLRTLSFGVAILARLASASRIDTDSVTDQLVLLQVSQQVQRALPQNVDFFDDVPTAVLHDTASKGSHGVFAETRKTQGESLSVAAAASATSQYASPAKPATLVASLLSATEGTNHGVQSEVSSALKPLEGIRKTEAQLTTEQREAERAEDPRAVGFGTRSVNSAGGGAQARKSGITDTWELFSLARAGAHAAIESAMPQWYYGGLFQNQGGRQKVEEKPDVDRSDSSAPGAVSFITR